MKKNFKLLFYMKKQKNYRQGPAPVYLRITIEGKRSEIATGRECFPEKWNANMGRVNGTKEEIRNFNASLDNLQFLAYEAHRSLSEKGELITAESIKNKIIGKAEKAYMLIEIFQDHNQKLAALVGREFATGTLKRYETSLRHTRDFLKYKYGISNIDVRKIDHSFIAEYDFYLRSVRNCGNNSAVKYISNFGKIIRICLSNGWITTDPFINYKGKLKTLNRIFLSEDEIQLIAIKQFATERLAQVRDVFLFCCFTGLAYSDVKKLKMSNINKGLDGEQWIVTNRQKTDERCAIPLLPTALKLLENYTTHPLRVNKDMTLPVPSNQKMNDYLKEIAGVCEINKLLTSHIARHTFATTITLQNGVPIESVSKMLGHSSIRQTQHYAKILDIKVSEDMFILKRKLANRYVQSADEGWV